MISLKSVKITTTALVAILLLAFGVRVYNLNYNSPFLDEALYIVLGEKVFSGQWQEEDPFGWVGGMPLLYPPLAALFGTVGGVLGARFLNVLLGTLSVYLMYTFARSLRLTDSRRSDEYIGLIAAAGMSILSVPIFLSRLASYDMLSFTLFLAGLVLLQRGVNLERPELWQRENRFFAAAIFFFFSFLAKYVTLLFFPWVAVWLLLESRQAGQKVFRHAWQYFVAPLAVASLGYIAWQFRALQHFNFDQIGDPQRNYRLILSLFWTYTGIPLVLALLGSGMLIFKRRMPLAIGLVVAALSVLIVHLIQNSSAAVHQHTFLSLIFLLPLAAYCIWHVVQKNRVAGTVGAALLISFLMFQSFSQVKTLQGTWPNTTGVMKYVQSATSNHEKLLSFEDDVTKLMVKNLQEDSITGIYNFRYKGVSDDTAYRSALADGYFDVVLFNDHAEGEVGTAVQESLTNHYAAIYNEHRYIVYKRKL